jgi:hypothetical protein
LFKLNTSNKKTEDRLRMIEAALFKADKSETLFEEFENRLIHMDVHMKSEQARFNEVFNLKFQTMEDTLFSYKN